MHIGKILDLQGILGFLSFSMLLIITNAKAKT